MGYKRKGGTHGSTTKAGKTRNDVNMQRGSKEVKHHSKKHKNPKYANRRKYEKMLRGRRIK
jgi:ribosomal protein S30